MGISERKERQMQEARISILEQAWQIVEKEGWQSLSIRKIADAIEYSTPFVYKHFESKDAILEAFTREGYNLLSARLQEARDEHSDPTQRLMAISEAYWSFAFANKKHYEVMFGLGIPKCETVRSITEIKKVGDLFSFSIEEVIAAGNNQGANKILKSHTLWSILHGMVSIEFLSTQNDPNMTKLCLDDAMDGFIKGLIY